MGLLSWLSLSSLSSSRDLGMKVTAVAAGAGSSLPLPSCVEAGRKGLLKWWINGGGSGAHLMGI